MTTLLLVIHILIAIILVGLVLIQKNEGGGLGLGGGGAMGGLMSTRGTANFLTHVTAVFATLFFLSTIGLALVFKGGNRSASILDHPSQTTAPVDLEKQKEKPGVPAASPVPGEKKATQEKSSPLSSPPQKANK